MGLEAIGEDVEVALESVEPLVIGGSPSLGSSTFVARRRLDGVETS